MMKAIIITYLLAICSVTILGCMTVQASEYTESYHSLMSAYDPEVAELANGDMGVRISEALDGYAVITDRAGLDTSLLDGCSIYEVTDCDWIRNLPTVMQDENDRYYVVDTLSTNTEYGDGYYKELYSRQYLRQITLSSNIRKIATVERQADGTARWAGGFIGVMPGVDDYDVSDYPGYDEYVAELNALSETLTPYALFSAAREKGELLRFSKNNGTTLVFPTFTRTRTSEYQYSYSDIWDGVGDLDSDNIVNASDAAQILIAAAAAGAGGDYGLTEARMAAADLNGDNIVNASDAALVLIYAAYVGAEENPVSLAEFLKNR